MRGSGPIQAGPSALGTSAAGRQHGDMEFVWPTVVAVLALLSVYAIRRRRRGRAPVVAGPAVGAGPGPATITLDVEDASPDDPRVRRLVADAALRYFAENRDAGEVVVVSRTERLLGRVPASRPMPPPASPTAAGLKRPPASRRNAESSAGIHLSQRTEATPRFNPRERPAERRPIAESYDLSPAVHRSIRDPSDPVDVVRAILEVAGVAIRVEGDTIVADDLVLLVRAVGRDTMMHAALNQAYLDFQASGARRGIVIGLELWSPLEVRRREMMAPALRHAGPDAIQRMADAAALGADPIAFALAPATVESSRARRAGFADL